MPTKRSLLLLGSTGFLGSSILRILRCEDLSDLDVLISHSSRINELTPSNFLNLSFMNGETFNISNLASDLNLDLVVINCAASRNSGDDDLTKEGNFTFPKMVLETLLAIPKIRIKWIQIETFWQYSNGSTPDESYVLWKNRFSNLLTESSEHGNILVEKLVLSHLIGPFDNPHRFLPRLFSKMLAGEMLQVNSPNEFFCLTDVRDVSHYLVKILANSKSRIDSARALFPSIEIQLQDIIDLFREISGSVSQIQFYETKRNSNPALKLEQQPPLLSSNLVSLRSLNSSFSDIARWLSTL